MVYELVNHSRWIQDHCSKRISPIPTSAGKTIKRDRLLEKIIGCHSENAVNDKIVKTSCGIRITASEAFSYSLMYFSVFLSFLSFPQISNHTPGWLFIFLPFVVPWDPRMNSQNLFGELKSLCRPPSHSVFHFASLPDCSVFDRYCISRQSTRYLMGGKGKLN